MRVGAARRLHIVAVAALLIASLPGCSGGNRPAGPVRVDWRPVPDSALVSAAGEDPYVATIAANPTGPGWIAGGVIVGPGGDRQVALWSSAGHGQPWTRAPTQPVAGRDGPNETIYFLTGGRGEEVAFGYRRSPTENYPRPSVWTSPDVPGAPWQEVLENREFFGGPDIVGFGGLTFGPHGYSIAGTWTGDTGGAVVSVWRSPDGRNWTHDTTAPAFQPQAGRVPFATGIADGPAGILLTATAEVPTRSDPTREEGELWFSATGDEWSRLAPGTAGPGSTFDSVASVPGGWLVAGTLGGGGSARPVVWSVTPAGRTTGPDPLPVAEAGSARPSAIAVTGRKVYVAGGEEDRAVLWVADLTAHGGIGHWRAVTAPPAAGFPLDYVRVAATADDLLVTLVGSARSAVWYTAPPA